MKYRLILFIFFTLIAVQGFSQVEGEEEDTEQTEEEDDVNLEDIDYDEEADTIDIEDIDVDDIEEDELAKQSNFPWEQFAVGGTLGNFQFGDITSIAVSPEVNFQVSDMFTAGLGGVYEFFRVKRAYDYRFGYVDVENGRRSNSGIRPYLRFKPVQSFPVFAQLEYERLGQETPFAVQANTDPSGRPYYEYLTVEQDVNNYNAGLGFLNGPYYIALLYNFSNSKNKDDFFDEAEQIQGRPYSDRERDRLYPYNALSFRAGLNIPLGGGNDRNQRRNVNYNDKYLSTE